MIHLDKAIFPHSLINQLDETIVFHHNLIIFIRNQQYILKPVLHLILQGFKICSIIHNTNLNYEKSLISIKLPSYKKKKKKMIKYPSKEGIVFTKLQTSQDTKNKLTKNSEYVINVIPPELKHNQLETNQVKELKLGSKLLAFPHTIELGKLYDENLVSNMYQFISIYKELNRIKNNEILQIALDLKRKFKVLDYLHPIFFPNKPIIKNKLDTKNKLTKNSEYVINVIPPELKHNQLETNQVKELKLGSKLLAFPHTIELGKLYDENLVSNMYQFISIYKELNRIKNNEILQIALDLKRKFKVLDYLHPIFFPNKPIIKNKLTKVKEDDNYRNIRYHRKLSKLKNLKTDSNLMPLFTSQYANEFVISKKNYRGINYSIFNYLNKFYYKYNLSNNIFTFYYEDFLNKKNNLKSYLFSNFDNNNYKLKILSRSIYYDIGKEKTMLSSMSTNFIELISDTIQFFSSALIGNQKKVANSAIKLQDLFEKYRDSLKILSSISIDIRNELGVFISSDKVKYIKSQKSDIYPINNLLSFQKSITNLILYTLPNTQTKKNLFYFIFSSFKEDHNQGLSEENIRVIFHKMYLMTYNDIDTMSHFHNAYEYSNKRKFHNKITTYDNNLIRIGRLPSYNIQYNSNFDRNNYLEIFNMSERKNSTNNLEMHRKDRFDSSFYRYNSNTNNNNHSYSNNYFLEYLKPHVNNFNDYFSTNINIKNTRLYLSKTNKLERVLEILKMEMRRYGY